MPKIKYKILSSDAQTLEGTATYICIRDSLQVLTISNRHAPLVSVLKSGSLSVFGESDSPRTVSFEEGFVKVQDNNVAVTILR